MFAPPIFLRNPQKYSKIGRIYTIWCISPVNHLISRSEETLEERAEMRL